jgi:hypothetical protein
MFRTSANTKTSVRVRPRVWASVRTPQAGGSAPRRTKINFTIFNNITKNSSKLRGRTGGSCRVGGGGSVSSAKREHRGSGGETPRKNAPAGRLAAAVVQLVLQNYRMLWMDMECDCIACRCINRRRHPAEFAEYTLCVWIRRRGYTCVYPRRVM